MYREPEPLCEGVCGFDRHPYSVGSSSHSLAPLFIFHPLPCAAQMPPEEVPLQPPSQAEILVLITN